jgi:pimeloyl-ACP methyl ester carboxylesterase
MERPLTLMLDGIWGRPRRFEPLMEMIRQTIGPAEMFLYNSSGLVQFEQLGAELAREIRRRDRPVNLIGFSMGGLVVRSAHLLDKELPIRKAVFLNSPHAGSMLAYAFPFGGIRQIRPNDRFIQQIRDVQWDIPTLATWCPLDTMVIPGRSARWERAMETITCPVPLHAWPIHSRSIWRRAVGFLAEESAQSNLETKSVVS